MSSAGKRSRGQDHGSPAIIEELLETPSEWTNVPDIIKMTLKGVYDTLTKQADCIRDIERILPLKANSDDILHELRQQLS